MAEEWGTVVIRTANKDVNQSGIAKELARSSGIDYSKLEKFNDLAENITSKNGYIYFTYECADWKSISEIIVKLGNNIEFYSRVYDEYGTADFYALTDAENRFHYSFDQGGDRCEEEGYEEEVMLEIAKWLMLIPSSIKDDFPDFVDTDDLEFDGP